jgi:hypothetical protein
MNRVAIRSIRNKILVEKRLKIRQSAVRYATDANIFSNIAYLTARLFGGMLLFLPIYYQYGIHFQPYKRKQILQYKIKL